MMQKLLQKFEHALMQPYWRLTRGQTLGVQGIVIRSETDVLLIRQRYAPGWQFPGGGVERSEHLSDALHRELHEEAGIAISGPPTLHGIFSNFQEFKGDRIVIYLVRDWLQAVEPRAGLEIAEQRFFSIHSLPDNLAGGTRRRLSEVFENRAVSAEW